VAIWRIASVLITFRGFGEILNSACCFIHRPHIVIKHPMRNKKICQLWRQNNIPWKPTIISRLSLGDRYYRV